MAKRVIHLIAAARPNFMKVAPLYHALERQSDWAEPLIVHTGQHYDHAMSAAFFSDLRLREPHVNLGIGSGTHAEQTGRAMIAYEEYCFAKRPDWVVVAGDVNSTLACALVASKLGISVAHLEAGVRSHDRSMPEEINRILTAALADLLWTPTTEASSNLYQEGVPAAKVEHVGNIMLDAYELLRGQIETAATAATLGLSGDFGIVTLHRPANVDRRDALEHIVEALVRTSRTLPLVFAVHPRTKARLSEFGLLDRLAETSSIHQVGPMSYVPFMSLVRDSRLVITDSGGIQAETTYLHIPCLTVRENTEWSVTLESGTNRLTRPDQLERAAETVLAAPQLGTAPPLWDGRAAERVVASLRRACGV